MTLHTLLNTLAAHPLETGGCFGPISGRNVFQELWEMRQEEVCVYVHMCVMKVQRSTEEEIILKDKAHKGKKDIGQCGICHTYTPGDPTHQNK